MKKILIGLTVFLVVVVLNVQSSWNIGAVQNGGWDMGATQDLGYVSPTYILTIINSTPPGTVSPTAGTHTEDSGVVINLTYSPASGRVFKRWQRNNINAIFGIGANDSSNFNATVYLNGPDTITAVDTIAPTQFTLTVAGTGVNSPANGAHVVDSNASTAISNTPGLDSAFYQWIVSNNVTLGSAATVNGNTAICKGNGTLTAVDTSVSSVNIYVNTASSVGGDGTTNNTTGVHRAYHSLYDGANSIPNPTDNHYVVWCDGTSGIKDNTPCSQAPFHQVTTAKNYILITTNAANRAKMPIDPTRYVLSGKNSNMLFPITNR